MSGTPSPTNVSTKLHRIATLAREAPQRALTTLAHHIDVAFLREAFRRTRKDGAPGVDGQTAAAYAEDLEHHLASLLDRLKSGTYVAPPVRRVYIPKDERGAMRPIGIPAFEDKVLQRAIAMVLEAVYEQDFLTCSYGFRPHRSAHQMLQALWEEVMRLRGGWILKVDIQSYFDTIDHHHLRRILDQRVRDGVIRRMIDKWLNAGVLEQGNLHFATEGTPQGGVISPMLSNIFLHHVLDKWFEDVVRPRMKGKASLVRFADDFVMTFETYYDAKRVMDVLGKRLGRFGLTLHPDKTRFIDFRPHRRGGTPPDCKAESFDFLGLTHAWCKSRKGKDVVRQTTAKSRFARSLGTITEWCRTNRHRPVSEQRAWLSAALRGHYAYYGITGNYRLLQDYRHQVAKIWHKWLARRTRGKSFT